MKSYIATFHGDLEYHHLYEKDGLKPMADSTLEDLLNQIVDLTGWGEKHTEDSYFIAPDPEDDKVEIWEVDGENKTTQIVWGFWGWHWSIPEGLEQGILPGHTKSLYELAMEGY